MSESSGRPENAQETSSLASELAAVLGAYLGELVESKRAALLGDGGTALPSALAEASGRRVHVFDPDAEQTAAAIARSRGGSGNGNVRYALFENDAELGLGAFDVVVIPDLARLASDADLDAAAVVEVAARMLAPRGFVAVATPHAPTYPEGLGGAPLDYLKLFDAVSTRFEHVRMLGAAPFAGVTVAAFGNDEEPDVAIDSSLTEHAEQPLAYVAIGSHQPLRVDPYLVVQLPWSSVASSANAQGAPSAPPPQDTAHAEAMAELTSRERNARKEAEERGRTITALSARVAELEEALEGAEARRRANQNDRDRALDEKQRELDAMLERIAELESELEQATASANEARAAAAQAAASEPAASPRQVQALEFQLEELRKALSEARRATDALRDQAARASVLETDRAQLEQKLAKTEAALALASSNDAAEEVGAEMSALEARLRERGERVAKLEADLREAERIGRELVRELASPGALRPAANEGAHAHAELAAQASRLTADLQAATWRVAALEQELGERAASSEDVARLEAALARALGHAPRSSANLTPEPDAAARHDRG